MTPRNYDKTCVQRSYYQVVLTTLQLIYMNDKQLYFYFGILQIELPEKENISFNKCKRFVWCLK